ncbi:hypothetical protein N5C67_25460 [Comamonas thiooxydans]|uniref:hypothetical protein n=1 Tax=Comamonas thiooxydans TaxID=363952 RepID=UPI002449C5B7|nr:hypothetical protein [Comamonas thiooxydans]MDH1255989.1 hypothetical protein [Comamonas thiooxydans]
MESCTPAIERIKTLSTADPAYVCAHPQEMYEAINRVESACRGTITASEIRSWRKSFDDDLNGRCKKYSDSGISGGAQSGSDEKRGLVGREGAGGRGLTGSEGTGSSSAQSYRNELDQMAAIALEANGAVKRGGNKDSNLENSSKRSEADLKARKPKDPNVNYAGQSCSYFTREHDESHVYSYADGVFRLYGDNYYICEGGYWKFLRKRNTLSREEIRRSDAVALEN